jgi:Lrp/AsnC family transcriptional regulator for asnA, asnC and gidA
VSGREDCDPLPPIYDLRMSQPSFDATDERILEALQVDGRRSFRDIAREIGVSEGTVRTRVRRLEAAGVLRFLAFVDPSQLGQRVLALVFARVEPQHEMLWGIVSRLRALPGVLETETMLEMQVHKFAYRDLAERDG